MKLNNLINKFQKIYKSMYEKEINEIKKGFEMFDAENKGQIDPFELKETMEEMNLKDKNPFIYELILSLCLRKDIKSRGGLTPDEFISLLQEKISDIESKQGIKTIYEVFSNSDDKAPMTVFYQVAKEVGDEEGGAEIRNLVELSKTGGKEIDFNEFYDIMKEKRSMNKYNNYSHLRNKSSSSKKSKSGKTNNKKEYESENDSSKKKYIAKTNEKSLSDKSGFAYMEKIVTEKEGDSHIKINSHPYTFHKDKNLNKKENNRIEINYEEEFNNNEKEDRIKVKRYHRRFRENRTNTEN